MIEKMDRFVAHGARDRKNYMVREFLKRAAMLKEKSIWKSKKVWKQLYRIDNPNLVRQIWILNGKKVALQPYNGEKYLFLKNE